MHRLLQISKQTESCVPVPAKPLGPVASSSKVTLEAIDMCMYHLRWKLHLLTEWGPCSGKFRLIQFCPVRYFL